MMEQQMEDEEQERQFIEMQQQNPWEELSDHENMVEEDALEPDYFIDKPPEPIFIPNEEGITQKIQVNDKDPDLYDYELEVEPVLEVLVGKALEHAAIEVIEDREGDSLLKHKRSFLQIKEAELMQTQRMEAARKRRIEETERRNLQQRTAKSQKVWADKKVVARQLSKNFLALFKRNTLRLLEDQNILNPPRDFSMTTHFIPQLFG